jgi:signal transduction histidine kinase
MRGQANEGSDSHPRQPGSGLGLAIVSEIAAVYDLTLTLENRVEGGFRAKVVFPDAVASQTLFSGQPAAT